MPPYLMPLQIFENYKKANPQKCKGKSTTEICRLAGLSNKQIAELKTTSAWLFCFDNENSDKNQDFSMTEILGGSFSSKTSKRTKQRSVKQTNSKHHPVYKDLMLDKQGKIDINQFQIKTLESKYPKNKFNIEYQNYNDEVFEQKLIITIKDKKGNKILEICHNSDDSIEQTTYKNGNELNYYQIFNGFVAIGRHIEPNGEYIQYEYDDNGKNIIRQIKGDDKGYTRKIYKNGELAEINKVNTNQNSEITEKYSHGILVSTRTYEQGSSTIDYVLLNKMKNIYTPNKYGYFVVDSQNVKNLVKAIDKNNVRKIMSDYVDKYGIGFCELLFSTGYDNKNRDKEKLLSHIEKLLYETTTYNPIKKIKDDQVRNDNYTSKNIYDVQYNGKKVFINNKTTGKKSILDFDKLLKNIKNPAEKILHMENFQTLPAEILEFYANEGITLSGLKELNKFNKKEINNIQDPAEGFYSENEKITLSGYSTKASTYIHEVLHAVDYDGQGIAESEKEQLKEAFELGLKRFEMAGYKRNTYFKPDAAESVREFYFSADAQECWARVGELLFYGECENQDILKQFWPEFIELEKQAIERIQNKPTNERHK